MQIYVHKNNQQLGPFTEAEIRAQLAVGTLSPQDHVWWQGQPTWLPLTQTPLATPGAPIADAPLPGALPKIERTSGLAIASLLANLGCCIGSIAAIILGHMALSAMKRDATLKGHGVALAGLIIGYVITICTILSILSVSFVTASMDDQVKQMFQTITSQLNAAQAGSSASSDDSTTNSDSTTNAPDSSTNNATAAPDSSTNSATDNK